MSALGDHPARLQSVRPHAGIGGPESTLRWNGATFRAARADRAALEAGFYACARSRRLAGWSTEAIGVRRRQFLLTGLASLVAAPAFAQEQKADADLMGPVKGELRSFGIF